MKLLKMLKTGRAIGPHFLRFLVRPHSLAKFARTSSTQRLDGKEVLGWCFLAALLLTKLFEMYVGPTVFTKQFQNTSATKMYQLAVVDGELRSVLVSPSYPSDAPVFMRWNLLLTKDPFSESRSAESYSPFFQLGINVINGVVQPTTPGVVASSDAAALEDFIAGLNAIPPQELPKLYAQVQSASTIGVIDEVRIGIGFTQVVFANTSPIALFSNQAFVSLLFTVFAGTATLCFYLGANSMSSASYDIEALFHLTLSCVGFCWLSWAIFSVLASLAVSGDISAATTGNSLGSLAFLYPFAATMAALVGFFDMALKENAELIVKSALVSLFVAPVFFVPSVTALVCFNKLVGTVY